MKRWYVLALVVTVFALCEAKEILKECPIISSDGKAIHIPHESNPHKFYKCNFGKKVEFTCPKNEDPPYLLCFNAELEVCDWPWNVTECMGPTPNSPTPTSPTPKSPTPTSPTPTSPTPTSPTPTSPTPTSPTPTSPTPTSPTPTSPTPTSPTPTSPTPTSPTPTSPTPTSPTPTSPTPTTNPWNCPANGKQPHPTNCKMYIDYEGHLVCCLQNLVFNSWLCACDLPRNVPSCIPTSADLKACAN